MFITHLSVCVRARACLKRMHTLRCKAMFAWVWGVKEFCLDFSNIQNCLTVRGDQGKSSFRVLFHLSGR